MKMKISDIKIKNRIREKLGDYSALMKSIETVGLLNPIILDENHELIAGHRRLASCKELGWEEVEVKILKIKNSELHKLEIECHENLGRLDLTSNEFDKYLELKKKLSKAGFFKKIANFFRKIWNAIKGIFSSKPKKDKK